MRVESFSIKRGRSRKEINLILVSRSSRGFRTTPANWFVFFLSCASGGSRTGPSAYAQQPNATSSSSEIFVLDRTLISRSAELWRRLYPAFELPGIYPRFSFPPAWKFIATVSVGVLFTVASGTAGDHFAKSFRDERMELVPGNRYLFTT